MPYAIQIKNDDSEEIWGPYESRAHCTDIIAAFVGVPESATVHYIGNPETLDFTGRPE